jgi:uncharacterized protein YyaL (SSP411 family)
VDWYEWGPEALKKAKDENKPLIISIGYSSCHWCHVMERESFMDTAVARIMNQNFVSIKIDREERPDIDQIYMNAAQLLSGSGGWPLNAFALPNGKPFYAATYFPKDQWLTLLQQIKSAFSNEHNNVVNQAESLTQAIQSSTDMTNAGKTTVSDQKSYKNIFSNWQSSIDFKLGGLVGAPKFPLPTVWEFLLQYHHFTGDKNALQAVNTTLYAMQKGGMYDHLGGGFARYTTDEHWRIPHFEKMLYDNGQLVSLYAHAYQVTQDSVYRDILRKTLEFISREMTSPQGAFYSSINADSEGEEGKYYVWTKKEIQGVLDSASARLFTEFYNVLDTGNWENEKNILYSKMTVEEAARKNGMSATQYLLKLKAAETALLKIREKRIHPSTDKKILTAWNAIMLKGYLDAYFSLGDPSYLKVALFNAHFLKKNMMNKGGKLYRNYNQEESTIDAFLDDYALLAKAYISLYQATFDIQWLEDARSLVEFAIQNFQDKKTGLFYYTAQQAENLVARKMELLDNVIPSSNSILAESIYLLGIYYDQDSYITMSRAMCNQLEADLSISPSYTHWASLMGLMQLPTYQVAIMGRDALKKTTQLQRHYIPNALYMGGTVENLPLLKHKLVEGRSIIYVCQERICKLPVEDVQLAVKQLVK